MNKKKREYLREVGKIYKWYDSVRKDSFYQSGKFQLMLLQEKNQKILDLQKEYNNLGGAKIMNYYDIDDIKRINRNTGHYFFDPDAMRFFRSRVSDTVYNGIGGVYFVTSEQFVSYDPYIEHERKYTVRQFNPESGDVDTVGDFNELTKYMAHKIAKQLSEGVSNELE